MQASSMLSGRPSVRAVAASAWLLCCVSVVACAPESVSSNTGCSPRNATRVCNCGNAPGRQVCGFDGAWSGCECADVGGAGTGGSTDVPGADPIANKRAEHFEWPRTAPGTGQGGGDCRPGHYEGSLEGFYQSPVIGNAPVAIATLDVTGNPGLQFDLGNSGNGELLEVTGGSFSGTALAVFPFSATIANGQLNCASGLFTAKLINGEYTVPFEMPPYVGNFEGDFMARYDPATSSFVDGVWSVGENGAMPVAVMPGTVPTLPPLLTFAGGTGTWTAAWTRP